MSRARGEGAGRWDRLIPPSQRRPGSGTDRWHGITARLSNALVRLGHGFLLHWDRITDRTHVTWMRFRAQAADGWDRVAVALGDRAATGWSKSRPVLRRPIVVLGIVTAALCVAAGAVLIRAYADAGSIDVARRPHPTPATASDQGFAPPSAVPSVSPGSVPEGTLPGLDVHVNQAGGYLFSYPSSWEIGRQGGLDRLSDPTGDVLMTFEVAPPGTLQSSSDSVVARIAAPYTDVQLDTGPIEQTPQGLPSLVVGGRGIGTGGDPARFLVITIQGPDGNRAIAVHFSPDAKPLEALPVIREVIASYRISTAD